jgi:hypothetical protein
LAQVGAGCGRWSINGRQAVDQAVDQAVGSTATAGQQSSLQARSTQQLLTNVSPLKKTKKIKVVFVIIIIIKFLSPGINIRISRTSSMAG